MDHSKLVPSVFPISMPWYTCGIFVFVSTLLLLYFNNKRGLYLYTVVSI